MSIPAEVLNTLKLASCGSTLGRLPEAEQHSTTPDRMTNELGTEASRSLFHTVSNTH